MDILDELMDGPEDQVNLDEIFPAKTAIPTLPQSAVRNRAATVALLSSKPEEAINNYQTMLMEAEQGEMVTLNKMKEDLRKSTEQRDNKGVMSVLSDPNISIEDKKLAIENVKKSQFLKDDGNTLLTNALEQESPGETIENEDARLSVADLFAEMYDKRAEAQGLVNAHAATFDSAGAETLADMLALYLPVLGNNLSVAKVASADAVKRGDNPFWAFAKAFALPGSQTLEWQQRFENAPPEKVNEVTGALLEAIKNNSGLIISNDNQFAQYDKMSSIFEEGGYGEFEKNFDNLLPLLEIFGLRTVRIAGKVLRAGAKASKATDIPFREIARESVARAPSKAPTSSAARVTEADLAKAPVPKTVDTSAADELSKLEFRRAELLAEASNVAEPRAVQNINKEIAAIKDVDVSEAAVKSLAKGIQSSEKISYKAAFSQAKKQLEEQVAEVAAKKGRLTTLLDSNKQAVQAQERIAKLDSQIETLKAKQPEFAISKSPIADLIERIDYNRAVRIENPASPANIIQQANPQKARDFHEAVFKSQSDEIAQALYGVDRTQAIINDVYPQFATASGKVISKPVDIQRNLTRGIPVDPLIPRVVNESRGLEYTRSELASARSNVVRKLGEATNLKPLDSMSSFSTDGSRIKISAVYGLEGGSFKNAQEAMEQAKYAFRSVGASEENITIMHKDGLDHAPVGLDEVMDKPGNYLVKLDTYHDVDPTDVTEFINSEVKWNFFDRYSPLVSDDFGGVTRYLVDPGSMFGQELSGAASVATDAAARFEKVMLEKAAQFTDKYSAFPKDRRNKIDDYIWEANNKEIPFDRSDLVTRGFIDKEIDALASWRDYWDGVFYLENFDEIRSLRADNFQILKTQTEDFFAKPIAKDSTIGNVYDPSAGQVIKSEQAFGDALYASNGTYARLRRPVEIDGIQVNHIVVRNTPREYLRGLTDKDQVLNYRHGYYQIQYNAAKFVDEILKTDAAGRVVEKRTIAVAGDTKEAERFVQRMKTSSGGNYRIRGDEKGLRRGSDDWWDVNSTAGRIAQRARGKLLEDASGMNHLGAHSTYVANPVDAAVRAAKSISGRTVNRPMLEAAKARAIRQFGDLFPSDGMGGTRWPQSVSQIGETGEATSKRIADARSTWMYIRYLENGYINSVDSMFKLGMNSLANALGSISTKGDVAGKVVGKAERFVRELGEGAPAALSKNAVFSSYIAGHPLRQWVVQQHQAVRTFAYNPKGWANGGIPKLISEYLRSISGLSGKSDFVKFIDESGLMDAVDKENLVRGVLVEAADSSSRVKRFAVAPVNLARKVGFDVAERGNLLGHSAAVYEKYIRKGRDMSDQITRKEAISEIRAISYDMNFAGDMAYNQTALSVIMQFAQVPHKAMLQSLNRRIPLEARVRMVATDMVLWGTPVAGLSTLLNGDILPEDETLRDAMLYGLETIAVNKFLSEIFEEDVDLDFSSLSPYSMPALAKFIMDWKTLTTHDALLNSPAGQMFLKDGGRFQNAMGAAARFFGIVEDMDETPEDFIATMEEVTKVFSGVNDAFKAKLLLETGKKYNNEGKLIDPDVNHVEGWFQALGFQTATPRDLYIVSNKLVPGSKDHKEAVLDSYKQIKRYYTEKLGVGNDDPKWVTAVTGKYMKVFENDPDALMIINQQLRFDLMDAKSGLMALIMKNIRLPDGAQTKDLIRQAPLTDEEKQMYLKLVDDFENIRTPVETEEE